MGTKDVHVVVEYNSYIETGKDVYASIFKGDTPEELVSCVGIGIGDTKEEAFSRAVGMGIQKGNIQSTDKLVVGDKKDMGLQSLERELDDLQKSGKLSPKTRNDIASMFYDTPED